jgi:hypothetical protein
LTIWPEDGFRDLGGHLDHDFEELRRGGMRVSEEVLFGVARKKRQRIVFRCETQLSAAGQKPTFVISMGEELSGDVPQRRDNQRVARLLMSEGVAL